MADILIYEKRTNRRSILKNLLPAEHNAFFVSTPGQLLTSIEQKPFPVTIVDSSLLKKQDLTELIAQLKFNDQNTVLILLQETQKETADESHILYVPFTTAGLQDLAVLIRYHAKHPMPVEQKNKTGDGTKFIGKSHAIRQILEQIELVKDAEIHLLITGETGSGKTELARYIHIRSHRNREPFVHINCAAIPENLLESELFGYKKGAFTGAFTDKTGIFGSARRGTVFLDEIGEIPSYLQAKLLKVVDEKDYYPVGSTIPKKVYARIITATNKNLVEAVRERRFREDLYYRLNTMLINIPPLRERIEDIPELFTYFVKKHVSENNYAMPSIDPLVFELLVQYNWPGNVRELQNIVERIVYRQPKQITPAMLPDDFFTTPSAKIVQAAENRWPLERVKREYAKYIFKMTDKNKSQAARILQIDIKTMRKLLRPVQKDN